MDDLAALFDAHDCSGGKCSRRSHTQVVLVRPEDVATPAAEIGLLCEVRDVLAARGLRMLEMQPTPRFDGAPRAPKPWPVRYDSAPIAAAPGALAAAAPERPQTWWARLRTRW